nr:hypothetical protein [uncultured Achromobacter sp.]
MTDQTKQIGDWKHPTFTDGSACTQSCTNGDVICCSRAALQGFLYTLQNRDLAAMIPELVAKGEAGLPAPDTEVAAKRV